MLPIFEPVIPPRRLRHTIQGSRTRRLTVLGAVHDDFVSEADGGKGQTTYSEGDMGMAPVNMEQAMGSFSPEWDNTTVGGELFLYAID